MPTPTTVKLRFWTTRVTINGSGVNKAAQLWASEGGPTDTHLTDEPNGGCTFAADSTAGNGTGVLQAAAGYYTNAVLGLCSDTPTRVNFYAKNVSNAACTMYTDGAVATTYECFNGSGGTIAGIHVTPVAVTPANVGLNGTLLIGAVDILLDSAVACLSAPVAEFDYDVPPSALTAEFTDQSTNSPTSWLWDFGDGATSTSQNPDHTYSVSGSYSVILTATNATGSDAVSHDVVIPVVGLPDPPVPAGVLLEIYAASPGAAKWDVAKWDEAVWSAAGWQDVTPYGIHVTISWGSNRPELGILTVPSAASWSVDYHDPDRILDPSNEDGPYFGDLQPYLPIRVSHRGTIVRVGYVTGISHNFKYPLPGWGYMRGADNITRLANAQVPSDVDLSDTLYARAVDAIAAAGLSVTVATPVGTDPPVSPWITGTREWSVWDWVKDAAQEVLYIPYIDRLGTLCFRPWAVPLARSRELASSELIDMAVVTDYEGLYSVIQARVDEDTITERALTPPPRYGARTYTRDEITIDAGTWAETVLADRGLHTLLWKPGEVRPLTAVSTELLATIEHVERVGITLIEQSPPVIAAGIVVGGEIDIIGKKGDEAIWRFRYELAQTATEPLIETGGDPTDYLLRTGGGEYLYPTGGS